MNSAFLIQERRTAQRTGNGLRSNMNIKLFVRQEIIGIHWQM